MKKIFKIITGMSFLLLGLLSFNTKGYAATNSEYSIDLTGITPYTTYEYSENKNYKRDSETFVKTFPVYKVNMTYNKIQEYNKEYVEIIDGVPYIVIATHDRVSVTATKRIGIRGIMISRTRLGVPTPHESNQYLVYNYDEFRFEGLAHDTLELKILESSDGILTWENIHKINVLGLISDMESFGYIEWANEVRKRYIEGDSGLVYLRISDILVDRDVTNDLDHSDTGKFLGKYKYNQNDSGKIEPITNHIDLYTNTIEGAIYPLMPWEVYPTTDITTGLLSRFTTELIKPHYSRYVEQWGTPVDPDPNPVPPVSIYEIRNYSTEYDISQSIPVTEVVTNDMSVSSVYSNEEPKFAKASVFDNATGKNGAEAKKDYKVIVNVKYKYIDHYDTTTTTTEAYNTYGEWSGIKSQGNTTGSKSQIPKTGDTVTVNGYEREYLSVAIQWVNTENNTACWSFTYKERKIINHPATSTTTKTAVWKELDADGDGEADTYPIELKLTAHVYFQGIIKLPTIYTFKDITVYNEAFPDGKIKYSTKKTMEEEVVVIKPIPSVKFNAKIYDSSVSAGEYVTVYYDSDDYEESDEEDSEENYQKDNSYSSDNSDNEYYSILCITYYKIFI